MVFEVKDDRSFLCRWAARPDVRHAFVRVLPHRGPGPVAAIVIFSGRPEGLAALLPDLRSAPGGIRILATGSGVVSVYLHLIADPALAAAHEALGEGAILESFVFADGILRVHAVVPRILPVQDLLASLQQRAQRGGWQNFRIIRAAELDPLDFVRQQRRVLTSDQESLLRLAVSLGYYDTPKGATLDTLSEALRLSVSPVHKRLKRAEAAVVAAFADPGQAPRRRPRRRPPPLLPATRVPVAEVTLRARPREWALAAFTEKFPGARMAFIHLGTDSVAREARFGLVALAPPDAVDLLVQDHRENPAVRDVEPASRDRRHIMIRVRCSTEGADKPGHPYAWFPDALSADVALRPVLIDGPDVALRFLHLAPLELAEVPDVVAEMARRAEWEEYALEGARGYGIDPACAALPPADRLTPRQDEILRIAYALGYYRTPRTCTLESVARTLGVSANAIHKNLAAAEQNLMTRYLSVQ